MENEIQTLLETIEQEQQVKILLAVESGSRAWGFPSQDSDYDIRFIYCHERDWYLSAFQKRDVVDTVFIGDLDAGGWDITKCLQLLHKGNAPLLEWLHSPIVYRADDAKVAPLRELAEASFNPKMIFHHYVSLAKKKLLDEKTATHAKSYLYGLRAVLCARWIVDFKTIPPVAFETLHTHYVKSGGLQDELTELLRAKLHLAEGDQYRITDQLMKYATDSLSTLLESDVEACKSVEIERYDTLLRYILTPS